MFEYISALRDYRRQILVGSSETTSFYKEIFATLYKESYQKLKLDTPGGRQNFIAVCLSFTRTRLKSYEKKLQTPQNEPNMDPTEFIQGWVFEHLSRNIDSLLMVDLLAKFMEFDGKQVFNICWKTSECKFLSYR